MALYKRGGGAGEANTWPGFVDAMTALLLVLIFVLSIFMIIQFVLREAITGKDLRLEQLTQELAGLSEVLALEVRKSSDLENRVGELSATLESSRAEEERLAALVASLRTERDDAAARAVSFEEQVAGLLARANRAETDLAAAEATVEELEAARAQQLSEAEAMQLALAQLRREVDSQTEAARLAASQRQAMEALIAELQAAGQEKDASISTLLAAAAERDDALDAMRGRLEAQDRELVELRLTAEDKEKVLAALQKDFDAAEQQRALEAAAAEALRNRLENADAELTAMTLALEEQRRKAEETLTLLAAAEAARRRLGERELEMEELTGRVALLESENARLAEALGGDRDELARALELIREQGDAVSALSAREIELKRQVELLEFANKALSEEKALNAEQARRVELLNQQSVELRRQLASLQTLLDESAARDEAAKVQLSNLGQQLNAALAQKLALEQREQKRLEEERKRLEEEAKRLSEQVKTLAEYRSDFFREMGQLLADREGVEVVGDRFVFQSEVLFASGSADLGEAGRPQLRQIARLIKELEDRIPQEVNWVLRVDGHTDNIPITGGRFADNWELSQARALSVVRFLVQEERFPPDRLVAAGFGEYQPIDPADNREARARNRRIELKLTER